VLTRLITRKDIEQTDATDLRDLLQQELPGVEFTYSMNQKLNMNVGGFAGQSVLILVDGERLAGETMENVDFSRIDMNNVERIEIVRGAQSALYGAGAMGGVINIITRGASEPWQ
jgi:outer membrane receptor for ferrienterochelin and colicins